ncbi:MAG: hypothetical protein RLZ91_842 [Bacteroidota bacterium]|jgi:hypothetical protein
MKKTALFFALQLYVFLATAQDNISINFSNDDKNVYHLSLIIYTPDGKIQTRVSNLNPNEVKTYTLPLNTEIYIADAQQEAYAMQGNDIKASGASPYLVLKYSDDKRVISLTKLIRTP